MTSFVSTSNNQKGLTSVCPVSIALCDVYPPSVVGIGCRLPRVSLLLRVGWSKFVVELGWSETKFWGCWCWWGAWSCDWARNDSSNRFSVVGLHRVEAMSSWACRMSAVDEMQVPKLEIFRTLSKSPSPIVPKLGQVLSKTLVPHSLDFTLAVCACKRTSFDSPQQELSNEL